MTLLLVVACEEVHEPGSPCAAGDDPTLTIGVGETSYEPVPDNTEIPLVFGPQGGWHVTMAIEATYLDISEPWTAELTGTIDGALVANTVPWVDGRCNEARGTTQGWNLQLIFSEDWEDVIDRDMEVHASVIDALGTKVTDDALIHVILED